MALMDSKSRSVIQDPLMNNNPITLQVLGICSALAVTVKMDTALVMSAAVVFVLTMSNTILSLLRAFIPSRRRSSFGFYVVKIVLTGTLSSQ